MVRFDYTVGRAARLDDRFVEAMETFEGRVLRDA
jgi:hypothetical protein